MRTLLTVCVLALAVGSLAKKDTDEKEIRYAVTHEVYFDINILGYEGMGNDYTGRVVIAVFGDIVPMTALNFVSLAKGYRAGGKQLTYNNTVIHRVAQDFIIQMGDITKGDGTGGRSIYRTKYFDDENFILSHRAPGWVAMANVGPNKNTSQFYIILTKARWLDGKNVVFGKVIRGWDVIDTIATSPAGKRTGRPHKYTKVVGCGATSLEEKYILTEEQLDAEEDL